MRFLELPVGIEPTSSDYKSLVITIILWKRNNLPRAYGVSMLISYSIWSSEP